MGVVLALLAASSATWAQEPPRAAEGGSRRNLSLLEWLTEDELEEGRPDADDPGASWPNAQDPGPDLANFPNASFTIPKGAFHVEVAPLTLYGPDVNTPNIYNTEFLLRYGLTDRVELRLFGDGYQSFYNGNPRKPAMSGFAPLVFDFKISFWSLPKERLWLPSMGLEAYVQTAFASQYFRTGTQPGLSLLLDHALPYGFQFGWNVGLNSVQSNGDSDGVEANFQWALQRRFFEKLDLFTHGFLNGATLPRLGDGIVVGGGFIYLFSKRVTLFGSYNAGLTPEAPTTLTQLGFAYAF